MKVENYELEGPALLLAGPGTGKTYNLARRIKYLIESQEEDPATITVITFTSAATSNMRDRISDRTNSETYVDPENQPKLICTMHSLGYKIICEYAKQLDLPDDLMVQTDENLRKILMEDAAQIYGFTRADAKDALYCKQNGACYPKDEEKCQICNTYSQILRSNSYIDYDDQILIANEILNSIPDAKNKYKKLCNHLLIDEFQDINPAQYDLIKHLSSGNKSGIFAVGDDDQSIYSWRGGSPKYIRKFKEYFGNDATVKPLSVSYRCPKNILEGSLSIVENNDPSRLPKEKFEFKNKSDRKIVLHNVPSDQAEARIVTSIVEKALPNKSALILIPNRKYLPDLITELSYRKINYSAPIEVPGEYLPLIGKIISWTENTEDNFAFRLLLSKLLNDPIYGIPSKRSKKPEKLKCRENELMKISKLWIPILKGATSSLWQSLYENKADDEKLNLVYSNLDTILKSSIDSNDSNIGKFLFKISRYFPLWKSLKDLLIEIKSWESSFTELKSKSHEQGVLIMTLQGAKGLEADVVCIIGMEDGVLPRIGSSNIEEESRLMHVSLTRSKNDLHIFNARKRSGAKIFRSIYHKDKKGKPDIKISRFLKQIPKEYIDDIFHSK